MLWGEPARVVGGSRAAADDTASGGSAGSAGTAGTGACPKPLVLLSKTFTFRKKYLFYLIKPLFFEENKCFA